MLFFCKQCLQSCGNTTNILFHLWTKHPTDFKDISENSDPDNSLERK